MNQKHLREENYLLKNQISELRNMCKINENVLRILSKSENRFGQQIFYSIIAKLTAFNNEAMNSLIDTILKNSQQKYKIEALKRNNSQLKETNNLLVKETAKNTIKASEFNTLNENQQLRTQLAILYAQKTKMTKIATAAISFINCHKSCANNQIVKQIRHSFQALTQEETIPKVGKSQDQQIIESRKSNKILRYYQLFKEKTKQCQKLQILNQELTQRLQIVLKAHNIQRKTTKNTLKVGELGQKLEGFVLSNELMQFALKNLSNVQDDTRNSRRLEIKTNNSHARTNSEPKIAEKQGRNKRSSSIAKGCATSRIK